VRDYAKNDVTVAVRKKPKAIKPKVKHAGRRGK